MTTLIDRILKRDGLYVSRPVMNADAWAKWAEKFKLPNPVPADKMHVTVIASRVNVTCKLQTSVLQVFTTAGSFGWLGTDSAVLAFMWCDWCLVDRNYQLIQYGAISDWPEFRPHISLSMDAKGFELSDAAVAEMPPSFILGPEVAGGFAPSAALKKAIADGEGCVLEEPARLAAADAVAQGFAKGWGELGVYDQQSLQMIAAGHAVSKAALESLEGKVDFATPEPETQVSNVFKRLDEDRMVYGFASVSIAKGAAVVDSHKHEITTKSLRKLCHGLVKGARAGKFDHAGDQRTEIVEAMVFDADIWKSMGDYFETIGELDKAQADVFRNMTFEGLMTGFHCADDAAWAIGKSVDFELSIGCEEGTLQELK